MLALLSGFAIYQISNTGPVTLRLRVPAGQVYSGILRVERQNPRTVGEIRETIQVRVGADGGYVFDTTLVGLVVNGKDRTSELKSMLRNPTASLGWTALSHRREPFSGLSFSKVNAELAPFVFEAGLYMGSFVTRPVKVGDSWRGSTTATGGCTTGLFTLRSFQTVEKKQQAVLEVTEIAMAAHRQLGPMRMSIDVATGMPRRMEYRVQEKRSGRETRFLQTMKPV